MEFYDDVFVRMLGSVLLVLIWNGFLGGGVGGRVGLKFGMRWVVFRFYGDGL